MYESFIRGEEEEEEVAEEAEGEDGEVEARAAVPEEAWAAARPSRNKELQVTVVATIIIIMVIILTHLNTELLPSKRKYWSQQLIGCGVFVVVFFFPKSRPISGLHSGRNWPLNFLPSTRPPAIDLVWTPAQIPPLPWLRLSIVFLSESKYSLRSSASPL